MADRRPAPSVGATAGLLVVAAGFLAGAGRLADNSFLTHLATGRLWWSGDGLPHTDPYTFTAAGEPWVVQSWLASVLYAGVEEVLGLEGVRLLMGLTTALLAALVWQLSRPARSLTGRLLVVLPVLVTAFERWSERPLLLGLLGLALLLLAEEGRLDPRWLVPVMWCWANSHGSWALGLVVAGLLFVGRALDRQPVERERRVLQWTVLGVAAAAIGPYGLDILTFPVHLLGRSEALAGLKEWQRASPTAPTTLAVVALAVVVAVGLARRWQWRTALPAAAFLVAGLASARNLLPAAFVLVPLAAPALEGFGSIATDRRLPALRAVWAAVVALLVVLSAGVLTGDAVDDSPFPVAADRWLREHDLDPRTHRVIAREFVGGWLEARYGATGSVYMDDRVEVLPLEVIEGHQRLLEGAPDWEGILGALEPDAVLWQADEELAALLADDDDWTIAFRDDQWVVALPRGAVSR